MRKSLPFASLLAGVVLSTTVSMAQQYDRFAYSVTDIQQGSNWSYLRKLNLQTGEYSQVLLNGTDVNFLAYDATSKKQLTSPVVDARYGQLANAAFGTGVAAVAYDRKNNRLYYTPMFVDQLRYIDLKTMKVFYVTDQAFTGISQKSADQGNIVTRMVIADDGNGYAMTNDGTQLVQFSTGKKLKIANMGTVVDDPANKGTSIHNSCSSFGGDMIADDDGNLYVFSARNHVFKVNIESKVATHLGVIKGLPAGFSVNGAVVNDENKIVVGTATQVASYYTIDHKTLEATPYSIAGTAWHSSDLANSNILVSGNRPKSTVTEVVSRGNPLDAGDSRISIFPNPVTNNQFVVQFNRVEAGSYTIQVTDVMGRQVLQQNVNLGGDGQAQTIKLESSAAKGVYLVKVTSNTSKSVFSTKIVVQ